MSPVDYAIVAIYFGALLALGAYHARQARRDTSEYFLGGRHLPWWALGTSGMSSNLDVAGTVTIIALVYTYGLHGFFIEMRGGVVLPIAVFLAFMGKWHERSEVVTTGEWMELRFGRGWQGRLARVVAALTYLVITISMVTFFVAAGGAFLAVFLPFSETMCMIGLAVIALVYTMLAGLYGVVWTDLVQAFLIGGAAIYVAVLGAMYLSPEVLSSWPGGSLNDPVPRFRDEALGTYELFAVFLVAWVGKGVLEGLGGSGGSAYMAQRFYAASSARSAQQLSMLWTILFAFRWPMVVGFVILGTHVGAGELDPEQILPHVLSNEIIPAGVRGVIIAAILAASMSTFDSTINAGASYVVKDIFEPLVPDASENAGVAIGYFASAAIVLLGLPLALMHGESVVGIWITIVIQLFPAFLVPFALRWYWARFNGAGFAIGVLSGFAASTALALSDLDLPFAEVVTLLSVSILSLLGCIVGTYLAAPTSETVLEHFYRKIRPFGMWPRAWKVGHRREHTYDLVRLAIALPWQVCTFLAPMTALLRQWTAFAMLASLWVVLFAALLLDLRRQRAPADVECA